MGLCPCDLRCKWDAHKILGAPRVNKVAYFAQLVYVECMYTYLYIEWIENLQRFRADRIQVSLPELPSLTELEAAYQRVQPSKATGPDLVDAGLCHCDPASFAKKTYALFLKLFLHGQESLQHIGGRLHPLWKQKRPRDVCSSYHSILISSHIGKSLHRFLRTHSADIFEKFLQKQQLGSKGKSPVTMGVHQARAFLRLRKSQGLCVGFIFLDLCEAFYRIVRELAIGGPVSDEVIATMGHRLGMGPDLLHELYKHLDTSSAIAQAGMNPQMQTMVQASRANTHFHVTGQADRCKTTLGTRPGDCWADFVFSFLRACLLKELEDELQGLDILDFIPVEHGLRFGALSDGGTHVRHLGPTWMDDSCFCLSESSPMVLERKAVHLCGLLLHRCTTYAMTPIWDGQDSSLIDGSRQRSQ